MNDLTPLQKKITLLKELLDTLRNKKSYPDKVQVLDHLPIVQDYLSDPGPIESFLKILEGESEFVIKAIIAIGQAPIVFNIQNLDEIYFKRLVDLLEQLLEIEVFYSDFGGIIGYYYAMLVLISNRKSPPPLPKEIQYIHPEGVNIEEASPVVHEAVRRGIESMNTIGVIYPLGGAGDRLNLKDETTGEGLPAALLPFLGRTLIDGLIRDLQGQEYLFYKLVGKQLATPIAIMTSIEKNNHVHILDRCKSANWFGKRPEDFHFFIQPLAPVITETGDWSLSSPLTLFLKPCGHGVLWKLAKEAGVFDWFQSLERHQCYIRQINNPIGGTDQGLLALIGIGCSEKKAFGFLSCERLVNSAEGMDVVIEKKTQTGYDYCLTNIEYTEFHERGIKESAADAGSKYSIYPANTNILFANIRSIQKALNTCSIPGKTINMKSKVPFLDNRGSLTYVLGGRLESTMQNIADYICDHSSLQFTKNDYSKKLQTFILYASRDKTISTTKKTYVKGESPIATPEQAYYDLLSNNRTLLKECGFSLPPCKKVEEELIEGPSSIFLFHPGLGPLYSVIKQKIRRGNLSQGAELQLEIAEVDIEDLVLDGSLLIRANSPLGLHKNGILHYGNESSCTLKRVTIKNQGGDRSIEQHYWKNQIARKEEIKIVLHEGAEFHAEDLILTGSYTFEVPAHCRMTLVAGANEGEWKGELAPLKERTWHWKYNFESDNTITLQKIASSKVLD